MVANSIVEHVKSIDWPVAIRDNLCFLFCHSVMGYI